MINLDTFRERIKAEIEKTKKIKSVQVEGKNLDDALRQASLELGLPINVLEYEILDKGSPLFFKFKNRPYRIVAYEAKKISGKQKNQSLEEELNLASYNQDASSEIMDRDGQYSVRLDPEGVFLKVVPPLGKGNLVLIDEVRHTLQDREVQNHEENILLEVVKRADMIWIKIGEFNHDDAGDASCSFRVIEDDMKVYMTAFEPNTGGADLNASDLRTALHQEDIMHGILEKNLEDFEFSPVYQTPFLVAEGRLPVHGEDARVDYTFDTETNKNHMKVLADGSVDYKELNKYHNVVKGQPLAHKIPPGRGRDGSTVYGRYIPARDGKDLEMGLGKNVVIAENGSTVLSTVDGHVMLQKGKITVETVLIIEGNVDASTGSIHALNSVEVRGNVEDGYTVSAQGKIEVAGYVGRANLNAGGDIIVSRGINGGESKEFGHIKTGKTIWASFIQNATVEAMEYVIVSSGIVNSQVDAQKKILCKGSRAKIVGGHIRALQEVNAVILGSPGGAETIIEVGFDPKTKEETEALEGKHSAMESEKDSAALNLQGLQRQMKIHNRSLTPEKKQMFNELKKKYHELKKQFDIVDNELKKKKEYLEMLTTQGKISASKKTLTGVILRIRDAEYKIQDPYEEAVTFVLEDQYIRTVKYQDIEEDLARS